MVKVNPDYLFKWEPEKKFLFFTTQSAHMSGIALKNLENVQPQIIDELKSIVNSSKPSLGSVITIRERYVFIITRKSYNSKHDLALTLKALNSLNGNHKMSSEDFPDIVELVTTNCPWVELKETSKWDDRNID